VAAGTDIVQGDVLDAPSLPHALEGIETVYYLVHSMGSLREFEEEDRRAAENFGQAAYRAGVQRIIYLGGLGDQDGSLSPHLRSRHEVGEILRRSGVPVVELRASIVIGCGSFSFEMIRTLVERLPVMITPRWVSVPTQPIAANDLIQYLVAAMNVPLGGNALYEIGGADVVSYGDLMQEYARQVGLRRWMIPVPVLTPRLSSLWLGLVTPYYARVGRKLVDSLRNPTVVRDSTALRAFDVRPMGVREAIATALANENWEFSRSLDEEEIVPGTTKVRWGGLRRGSRILDLRAQYTPVPPQLAFAPIWQIGGQRGWYYGDWLWKLRGWVDRALGGVGLRRGRRDPGELRVGDVVDFWRVEALEPGRRLRLAAEMKLPGRAWLEFRVRPKGDGALVQQMAIFSPRGLLGLAYWYLLYPLHSVIFSGMLREIAARTAQEAVPR
jgi:uncharacterized protein YbjT (DUF2867 family)